MTRFRSPGVRIGILSLSILALGLRAEEPVRDRDGDPLPTGAVARFGSARLRHTGIHGEDEGFVFRPDSRAVATVAEDSVRLWDVADGKRLWHLDVRGGTATVVFAPDGKRLAVLTGAGVLLVDAATGTVERSLKVVATAAAFAPDGKILATVRGDWGLPVELWDLSTGERSASLEVAKTGKPQAVAFAPDGKTLTAALWGTRGGSAIVTVASWDLASKERQADFDPNVRMHSYRLSADGRRLGTKTHANSVTRVWEVATGKVVGDIEVGLSDFNFAPDGSVVITAHNRSNWTTAIMVWDPVGPRQLRGISIPRDLGATARLSPDGKLVATASRGDALCLWEAATGERRVAGTTHDAQVTGLTFSPDGAVLVSTTRKGYGWDHYIWDAGTAARRAVLPPGLGPFAVRPGGSELVAGRDAVRRFDLMTGKPIGEPFAPPPLVGLLPGDEFKAITLAVTADGKTAVARGEVVGPGRKNSLRYEVAWDIATGKPTGERTLAMVLPQVHATTPDWRTTLNTTTVSRPNTGPTKNYFANELSADVKVSDGATGRLLCEFRVEEAYTIRQMLTADGQTAVTVSGPHGAVPAHPPARLDVRLWEVRSGRERGTIPLKTPGHYDPTALAVSADGRLVAVTRVAGRLEVFDTATGRELLVRDGFESPAYAMAFRPDGHRLATGHADGTVLLWNVPAAPTRALNKADLEAAWADLTADDPARANATSWALAGAGRAAVEMLADRVRPADANAADRIRTHIADLDSPTFAAREAAARELADWAPIADGLLREAARGKLSAEQTARLQRLLDAPAIVRNAEHLRTLRAIETLERIGTPEAAAVLRKLAAGSAELRPTREAAAALDRVALRVPLP
jgi:WD40 repeat protein